LDSDPLLSDDDALSDDELESPLAATDEVFEAPRLSFL
jgi:hypothetical protein